MNTQHSRTQIQFEQMPCATTVCTCTQAPLETRGQPIVDEKADVTTQRDWYDEGLYYRAHVICSAGLLKLKGRKACTLRRPLYLHGKRNSRLKQSLI